VYASTLFTELSDVSTASQVGKLAAEYARQNQSILFDSLVTTYGDLTLLPTLGPSASVDLDAVDMVTVLIRMRVVEAHVAYRPGPGEIIKWAWVQYFCVAYVIHWVVSGTRWLFVKQALINTIAVWEGQQHH
jgi:transmembrane protein 231